MTYMVYGQRIFLIAPVLDGYREAVAGSSPQGRTLKQGMSPNEFTEQFHWYPVVVTKGCAM